MAMTTHSIQTTQRWLYRVGVVTLAACTAHAVSGGWALADGNMAKGVILAAIMVAATVGAAMIPPVLHEAWRARMWGPVSFLILGLVLCYVGEGVGNTIAMGHTRNSSTTIANVADQQMTDRRKSIGDTERSIATLEAALGERNKSAGWLSTKPSAAWKADVRNLEGDKLFARSKQCGNVTLADSRAFCDRLTEARANLAVAEAHETDAASLAKLRTTLADLRDQSRGDKPGISAARTQSDNIVRASAFLTGAWAASVGDDDRTKADFGVVMFMMIFMMFTPGVLIYAGSVDWTPGKRTGNGWFRKASAWVRGEKLPDDQPTASAPIANQVATEQGPRQQDGYSKPAPLTLAPTHRETLIIKDHDRLNEILARWAGSHEAKAIAA